MYKGVVNLGGVTVDLKQKEIKLVIGAGEYNNNPGWLHTQEKIFI